MLKSGFPVLTVALLFVFAPLLSAKDDSRWLVPRSRVAQTDLKIIWQHNLPLADSETLDQLLVVDNRLLALSSHNYLSCLNRADGNEMFSNFVAPPGLPVVAFESYKGELITIVGDELVEISADFGTEKTPTNVTGGVTCPVVRNDSFFYIAGIDKRLHALRADDHIQVFEAAAENDSLITSVLADKDVVVFATEAGNVVCIAAGGPRKLWQFDAPAAVAGLVVRDDTSLYFACRDASVYRLELSSGKLLWKYQTQAILDASPQLGGRVVYQCVPDAGLIALDKESVKKPLWQVPDGIGLLAESGDKAFVITKAGMLVAMDNVKAKKLYSVDIGRPVKYAVNTVDSRIYIADTRGRLACLQPAQ